MDHTTFYIHAHTCTSHSCGYITSHVLYCMYCTALYSMCRCASRRPSGSKNESEWQRRRANSRAWNRFMRLQHPVHAYCPVQYFWTCENPCVAWLTRGDRCPWKGAGFGVRYVKFPRIGIAHPSMMLMCWRGLNVVCVLFTCVLIVSLVLRQRGD